MIPTQSTFLIVGKGSEQSVGASLTESSPESAQDQNQTALRLLGKG